MKLIVSFLKNLNIDGQFSAKDYNLTILVEEKKTSALKNIIDTKGKVKTEINALKDKLKLAREKIVEFKNQLAIVTQN